MLRRTFWPESTTHVTPKEVVDDGNGGTCAMPLRWPWAREAAFRVLRAQELDFVARVELDASKPFEVVCVVPKVSDDFGADVQRVHDLLAKALDIAPVRRSSTLPPSTASVGSWTMWSDVWRRTGPRRTQRRRSTSL